MKLTPTELTVLHKCDYEDFTSTIEIATAVYAACKEIVIARA